MLPTHPGKTRANPIADAVGIAMRASGVQPASTYLRPAAPSLLPPLAPSRPAAAPAVPPPRSAPMRPEEAERHWAARLAGTDAEMAEILLREALLRDPHDAAALKLLGEAALKRHDAAAAATSLSGALAIAPEYDTARHLLAVALFEQSRIGQAMAEIRLLLARQPDHPGIRILLGSCLAKTGDFDGAIRVYDDVLTQAPGHFGLWQSYAQALKSAGRRLDSEAAFRRCLAIDPRSGGAHWGLQNLSAQAPARGALDAMRTLLADPALSADNRFPLHYALGYALEKSGDYQESLAQYEAGAKIRRRMLRYDPQEVTDRVRRTQDVFSAAFLAARKGSGCPDASPIFIVGMPRAGSTLIEQILASHSRVEGTQELPVISHLAEEIGVAHNGSQRFPECLADCTPDELATLGLRYGERCRAYRRTDRPFFVDKMPGNWINIGLIHLILPEARIIDARRNKLANCFGAFKKYFSVGQDFSYDFADLGRYYRDYDAMMAHYNAVLPGRVHRVDYEDLVTATEAEVRRLLAYCRLPFEPSCLRFWETRRAVSTASAEQVRRPIYREALEHWRNYEPWLGRLQEALDGDPAPS